MSNIQDKPEIHFSSKFLYRKMLVSLCVLHYEFYLLVTMKDCKNRHNDQRHMWDWWEEKEFISSRRKWVCCSRLSKSKVETAERLLARLLWEPGAQNHLRSPTLLPRGHPCPLQALSMFKSFISGERLRGRRGVCHIKLKAREKKNY